MGRRSRLSPLSESQEAYLHVNGSWSYKLSALYYEPAVTAAVEKITAEEHAKVAA
jgi:hypothetical protein